MTAVENTVNAVVSKLVSHKCTAITQDATCHVQLDLISDIDLFKRPPFFLVTRLCSAMLVREILKITFPGLVTYGTINRVIY